MKWFLFIFIHCILYSNSNIDNKPIGEIIEIKGKVKLISKDSNLLPIPLVSGRYIFDGDIIQSKLNDEIKIKLILSGVIISVSDLSEIQLNYDNNITYVKLNYGKIFSEDKL